MQNTNEIMLDIETLSTQPNASILSIGAIRFNRTERVPPLNKMDTFYIRIDMRTCDELMMHVDQNTVAWWNKQDEAIRNEAMGDGDDRVSVKEALTRLTNWIGINKDTMVWGNGDDFDCVILGEAYRAVGLTPPWKFWNTRDVRTVLDLACIKPWNLRNDYKHHPVNDCYRQVDGIKKAFDRLNLYNE
jgi:hypothetical protein